VNPSELLRSFEGEMPQMLLNEKRGEKEKSLFPLLF
jgi:hypothetical protein